MLELAEHLYSNSRKVKEPLKNSIRDRQEELVDASHIDAELNREVKNDNNKMHQRKAEGVHKEVTANVRKVLSLAEQIGSSSWLSTLPVHVEENGFALHKGNVSGRHCYEVWMVTNRNAQSLCLRQSKWS